MSSSASSIYVTLFFQFHLIGSETLKNICRSDMFVVVLLFDHHDQVFKGLIKGPKQLPDYQVICDVWSTEGNQLSGESGESIVCGLNPCNIPISQIRMLIDHHMHLMLLLHFFLEFINILKHFSTIG